MSGCAARLDRRAFLSGCAAGAAGALLLRYPWHLAHAEPVSPAPPHYASGRSVAVATASKEATEAALWALAQGGNAADAYMTAALAQTVVQPGLTSLGGAFGVTVFDATSKTTRSASGLMGPAAAESYDYARLDPVSLTGRGMTVPGFLAGIALAHRLHGRLAWAKLFEPAIRHAKDGIVVSAEILGSAKRYGARHPEGRALWSKDGRFLQPGEPLLQPALGRVLEAVAQDGIGAFYEGELAKAWSKRSRADGGSLTRRDMAKGPELAKAQGGEPDGNYRGYRVWAPRAGLLTYALHLSEALDLRASGPSRSNPESVFRHLRILEEVFHSTKTYSKRTHEKFASPEFAKQRAEFVLTSPLRDVMIDAIFNTCFLVIRDKEGNAASGYALHQHAHGLRRGDPRRRRVRGLCDRPKPRAGRRCDGVRHLDVLRAVPGRSPATHRGVPGLRLGTWALPVRHGRDRVEPLHGRFRTGAAFHVSGQPRLPRDAFRASL